MNTFNIRIKYPITKSLFLMKLKELGMPNNPIENLKEIFLNPN
jgi:hypothetical protein